MATATKRFNVLAAVNAVISSLLGFFMWLRDAVFAMFTGGASRRAAAQQAPPQQQQQQEAWAAAAGGQKVSELDAAAELQAAIDAHSSRASSIVAAADSLAAEARSIRAGMAGAPAGGQAQAQARPTRQQLVSPAAVGCARPAHTAGCVGWGGWQRCWWWLLHGRAVGGALHCYCMAAGGAGG